MDDEIKLQGVVLDAFKNYEIPVRDLELIFDTCTQCASYKKACYDILKTEHGVTIDTALKDQKVRIGDVFQSLENSTFMTRIPPFLNQRSTITNIKLIKASIIIGYKKWMPYEMITSGIIAFQLMEKQLQAQSREKKERKELKADSKKDEIKPETSKKSKEQSFSMQMYLPQDPVILNQTMMLCNRVMSEVAIKKWIKEHNSRRRFECSEADVLTFNGQIREIENEIKEKWTKEHNDAKQKLRELKEFMSQSEQNMLTKQKLHEIENEIKEKQELLAVPDLPPMSGYLTCPEFLFLLCNAVERQSELRKQKAPEFDIRRKVIDDFDPNNVNGIRLDYLYMLDTVAWQSWLRSKQPSKRMMDQLNAETLDKKIIINNLRPEYYGKGQRSLEDDTLNAIKNLRKTTDIKSSLNELSNRDSQSGMFNKHRKDKTSVKSKTQRIRPADMSLSATICYRPACQQRQQESSDRLLSTGCPHTRTGLSIIKEKQPMESRSFSKETILEFRKKIADNDFFKKLQLEVEKATMQLCRTRLGGQSDYEYLKSLHDRESQFGSPTRQLLKNDKNFRSYVAQNPVKGNPIMDFSKPVSTKKYQKLMFFYSKVSDIKANLRKIRRSQNSAIKATYDALKGTKDNMFSEANVERQKTNKTIIKALKSTKQKKDDDTGLTSPIAKEQQLAVNPSRRNHGQRLWEDPPYRDKSEFAASVKVKHKEPTEPQDDPSKTFYGVMSKVYKDAYQVHNNLITSPAYLAQQEEGQSKKVPLTAQTAQNVQIKRSQISGGLKTPQTAFNKASQKIPDIKSSQLRSTTNVFSTKRTSARPSKKATITAETPYTQNLPCHKNQLSQLSDYVANTPVNRHNNRIYSGHQYTQPNLKYKSEVVFSDDGNTEATHEASLKREETAPGSGHRVRSAAASVIFRKWGYDTTKLMKDKSIDFETFVGNQSLREGHTAFMYRIDNALEKEVVREDATNYKLRQHAVQRSREIEMIEKVPPVKEVYTNNAARRINILD